MDDAVRRILIVDDLDTIEYSIEGMMNRHCGDLPFETTQVTSPSDIAAAVEALPSAQPFSLALVDLDFGAHQAGSTTGHGLTALRLLAELSPATTVALYTADVEDNRELMLRAAFELSPYPPTTWISKASARFTQARHIYALMAERTVAADKLRPYVDRPKPLRLASVCGTTTQLRLWQAMALGLETRKQIADHAHTDTSTLDKHVARAREFILDCTTADRAQPGHNRKNLQLACRFAYTNRAFFWEPELERIVQGLSR